jgi:hypothetical protein
MVYSVLKMKFFAKTFVLKYYFSSIISVRPTHLWEKGSRIRTLTNGSGSGRPKNMKIRIHNTVTLPSMLSSTRLERQPGSSVPDP